MAKWIKSSGNRIRRNQLFGLPATHSSIQFHRDRHAFPKQKIQDPNGQQLSMTMLATRGIYKWKQLHLKMQFKCNRILAEKYQIDFSILFI